MRTHHFTRVVSRRSPKSRDFPAQFDAFAGVEGIWRTSVRTLIDDVIDNRAIRVVLRRWNDLHGERQEYFLGR